MLQFDPKNPADTDTFRFDWTQFVGADPILPNPTVTTTSTDFQISDVALVGNVVTFNGAGGSPGESVAITCAIATQSGRTATRTAYLPISNI